MEITGFIAKETHIENAVLFCFKDHITAGNLYKNLYEKLFRGRFNTMSIFSSLEEYPHIVIIESINRPCDTYYDGKHKKEDDLNEELEILKSVVTKLQGDYKIKYSGDFPQLPNELHKLSKEEKKYLDDIKLSIGEGQASLL